MSFNLNALVSKVAPTFSRDSITDELEELDKLNRVNLKSLDASIKSIPNQAFVSQCARGLEDGLLKQTKIKKGKNFLYLFQTVSNAVADQLPMIDKLVNKEFDEQVSSFALNLKRVNLLQYVPVIGFVVDYIRRFTTYALALEVNAKGDPNHPTYELLPFDTKYLGDNMQAFIDSVDSILNRGKNLEAVFDKLPDVSVDPSNAKMIQQTQGSRVDPLVLGVIPLPINPFYWVGMLRVNWQVERYHRAVGEAEALQLKAYNLKLLNENRNDVKIEREVKYLEEKRINPLKEKIADMEAKFNAD